jgi:hypothetical protein
VSATPLLLAVLARPERLRGLDEPAWDLLLRQAEAARLGATLHALAGAHDALGAAPARARRALEWADTVWRGHARAVRFESECIRAALAPVGIRPVLLKGAAYVGAGLPAALGRRFSDIDILVPKSRLADAEAALMLHGWRSTVQDAYDQRYYREWMHELPPMAHGRRGTAIDVHHAILPETAALRPDPALLLADARPAAQAPGCLVLAPADMVLHSAVHLFSEGELKTGLRDLYDLHSLLGHFGAEPGFWEVLPERARALQLERPLFYALRYCTALLGTAVPAPVLARARHGAPPAPLRWLMDRLYLRALLPNHASCRGPLTAAAHGALYIRGNWLRMPPLLLARHLFHKAVLSERKSAAA